LWMELLTPKNSDTQVIAGYQHPFWGDYAAVTESSYGAGRAMYLGFLPGKSFIIELFHHIKGSIVLKSQTSALTFPLITRQGTNRLGKEIRFIFNYSATAHSLKNPDSAQCLLSHTHLASGDEITLEPWGLRILQRD
jgi:beta-galactosidase